MTAISSLFLNSRRGARLTFTTLLLGSVALACTRPPVRAPGSGASRSPSKGDVAKGTQNQARPKNSGAINPANPAQRNTTVTSGNAVRQVPARNNVTGPGQNAAPPPFEKTPQDPVAQGTRPSNNAAVPPANASPGALAGGGTQGQASANCLPYIAGLGAAPFFIRPAGLVVTRLMNPCLTTDGREGYDRSTSWMAMGFPCSGGGGRVQWGDRYANPRFVTFSLATDCPMIPQDSMSATSLGRGHMRLDERAQLLSYTPFVARFYEVIGMPDADVGQVVDLRSSESLRGIWTPYTEGKPFRVQLFGRENAWVASDQLFQVEAEIAPAARNRFRLNVVSAKGLSAEETAQVMARCEALRPKRNCRQIF